MKKKSLIILISILGLLLIGGVTYYYFFKNKDTSSITANIKEATFVNSDEYNITLSESITLTKEGIYYINGSLEDGTITINSDGDIKLVLNNVNINSSNGPAINVENANVVYIELNGDNKISTSTNEELNAAIYSADDLVIEGDGNLSISSNYTGIKSKDKFLMKSGNITINASDDGIHANEVLEINGGKITITMAQGDTDGVDSNGNVIINGGTINVSGQSAFDYDGTGTINGGKVICNGKEVSSLPNQMMGGNMPGGMPRDKMGRRQ